MWFDKHGNDEDVVLSSTAVIYRNIKGFPFASKMSTADKENILGMVKQAVADTDQVFIRGTELDENMTRTLFDQRLLAARFLDERDTNAVILDKNDEGFTTIVNGNEHLVIRKSVSGSAITEAYKGAESFAVEMEKKLDIAFTEKLGFLTSGISSIGTGMFIGASIVIPGVETTVGAMSALTKRLEKYDWVIRPAFKSDKGGTGGIYSINGMATLGVDEKEIIDRAVRVINDVVKFERSCRLNIYKKKSGIVQDQFYKSYGVLRYARRLDRNEAAEYMGRIRLGMEKFVTEDIDIDYKKVNHICNMLISDYDEAESKGKKAFTVSKLRAEKIRKTLKGDD